LSSSVVWASVVIGSATLTSAANSVDRSMMFPPRLQVGCGFVVVRPIGGPPARRL
jgi:hypothetical protein